MSSAVQVHYIDHQSGQEEINPPSKISGKIAGREMSLKIVKI